MIFKNEDERIKKRSDIEETDSFWDIGDITPFNSRTSHKTPKVDIQAVIVTDDGFEDADKKREVIPSLCESTDVLLSYSPDNFLIKNVNILSWPTKYTFYERFRLDARKYFNLIHSETAPVKYFSYMPSYAQMSPRQRAWYFYWRGCVRQGIYLPTDSSYILLYVYEIINLPELIPAEEGLVLMLNIWENYRNAYTKLDKFLSEWVCDYCLINNIALPEDKACSLLEKAKENSALKQFYINCREDNYYASLLLEKCVSYRWRSSKYIDKSNRELFEKHISEGFIYAVNKLASSDGRFDGNGRMTVKRVVRDSFSGALCAYNVKRKIEVAYIDLLKENDLSFVVTDIVRYCENRVRAYLGIRARLTIQNLTEYQKNVIDEYFDEYLPCVHRRNRAVDKANVYEIECAPKREFSVSFEKAREIEKESWRITDRLVDDEIYEESPTEFENKNTDVSIESESLDIAKEALYKVIDGDMDGFNKIASESYMLPETLAECVNELCFEFLGDVGIEENDGVYRVISDYEQEIRQWLNR
ncbi:MAG: hypothetical protein E7593_06540 [Ruminococcaceae bacterium]|nr:hypothetical protein [Oscillospiraceae bacterium]